MNVQVCEQTSALRTNSQAREMPVVYQITRSMPRSYSTHLGAKNIRDHKTQAFLETAICEKSDAEGVAAIHGAGSTVGREGRGQL